MFQSEWLLKNRWKSWTLRLIGKLLPIDIPCVVFYEPGQVLAWVNTAGVWTVSAASQLSALSSLLPCEWEAMASLWLLSLRVWTKAAVLIINRHTKRRRRKRRRRRWLYSKLHPLLLFGHWRPHVHNCQRLSRPPVGQELNLPGSHHH